MINLNKKDAVTDAVKSILTQEEIDVNARTKDDIGGRKKSAQKDDVGPAADGKSTKFKLKSEEVVTEGEKSEKVLAKSKPVSIEKKEGPEAGESVDTQAKKENKSLKGFKEKYEHNSIVDQMINEVLSKDASAGAWIHDFVNSDNPQFSGKSEAKRKEMALGAYYAKQRNEEVESVEEALKGDQHKIDKNKNNKIDAHDFKLLRKEDTVEEGVGEKVKTGLKKFLAKVGGGSDEDQRKRLQKNMGVPQTGKPSMAKQNEEVESVEEGWDDMVKAAKDSVKSGPKPSGGAGVKQGTRYGGGKQKEKPEQEVKEEKEEPFDGPYKKKKEVETDKSGAKHTPMSRAKNLAKLAMGKMKKELGQKGK